MAEFFFTHKAVEDLKDFWNYTVQAWSEHQAEDYYEAIIQCCNDLASQPGLGKSHGFNVRGRIQLPVQQAKPLQPMPFE